MLPNRKLRFSSTIKDKFRQENCLQLTQKRNQGEAADLAKHRLSEHKLNIEVGRYQKKSMMIAVMKQ